MKTMKSRFVSNFVVAISMALLMVACISVLARTSTKPITRTGLEESIKVGGLQDSELIGILKARGVDFVLTPQISTELRGLGASPAVIQAVGANYRGPAATNPNGGIVTPAPAPDTRPAAPTASYHPPAPGIYLQQGGAWNLLRQESVGWRKEGLMKGIKKLSGGLINGEALGEVPGAHSPISAHAPATFVIRPEDGLTMGDYMIVHLHGKRDDREFKISVGQLRSEDEVDFRPAVVDNNLYEVTFSQGQGDYAFITRRAAPTGDKDAPASFLFTFQIAP